MDNKNLRSLHKTLQKAGYNPPAYEQFARDMEDDNNLRGVYSTLKKEGYTPPAYDQFKNDMGFGGQAAAPSAPAQQRQAQPPTQQVVRQVQQPPAVNARRAGTTQPQPAQQTRPAVRQVQSKPKPKQRKKGFRPTAQQYAGMQMMFARGNAMLQGFKQAGKNNREYIEAVKKHPFGGEQRGLRLGVRQPRMIGGNKYVVRGQDRFNPRTGKMEARYITPGGHEFSSEIQASNFLNRVEHAQYRQEHPLEADMQDAYKERDRLDREIARRTEELNQQNRQREAGQSGIVSFAASLANAEGPGYSGSWQNERVSDPELSMLWTAKRKNEQRIKTLEREKNQDGFWTTLGKTLFSVDTWDFGAQELRDAGNLAMYGDMKMPKGAHADAQQAMMRNTYLQQVADQQWGENDTFMQRAGEITGQAIPFVVEFMATGGFGGVTAAGTKLGSRAAARWATGKVGRWVLKNTGTLAGDMAAGFLMANTTGAMNTAADIMNRHQGYVVMDENGDYKFEGGKSWGRSIYEGEMANTLEYYTEKLGVHLDGGGKIVGSWLGKGMERIGAGRVSELLSRITGSEWSKATGQLLRRGGIQDYPGEVIEEEANLILNSLLVGDNKFSDLVDGKTQADIWGGMLLSIGFMQSPGTIGGVHDTAQYYRYKHNTDKSDRLAGFRLTADKWEPWRERIDNTNNADMMNVVTDVLGDENLSPQEKEAVMGYVGNLMKMRGYNLRTTADAKDQLNAVDEDGNPVLPDPEVTAVNEAFRDGYNMDNDAEMQDARNRMVYLHDQLTEFVSDDMMSQFDDDPMGALSAIRDNEQWTDDEKQAALDYVNARTIFNGMVQRVRDDIDTEIAASDAMIDSRVFRGAANPTADEEAEQATAPAIIIPATLKERDEEGNDKQVYIVSGNVQMLDDGTMVDTENSDQNIVVVDADSGKVSMISINDILNVDEALDAEQVKEEARNDIVNVMSKQASDRIDGTLPFMPGDNYMMMYPDDGSIHNVQIAEDLGDGTVSVLLDDAQEPTVMSKEDIQGFADKYRIDTLQAEDSVMLGAEDEEQNEDNEPDYALNDVVSLQTEDGTVRGQISNEANEDGLIEVYTEKPIGGKKINLFTREQLNNMLVDRQPAAQPATQSNAGVQPGTEQLMPEQQVIQQGINNVGEGLRDAMNEQASTIRENDINNWLQRPEVIEALRPYADGAHSVDNMVERALADTTNEDVKAALQDILRFPSSRKLVADTFTETPAPVAENEMQPADIEAGTEEPQQPAEPMPMREVGTGKNAETEPDWLAVTPERGHDWLFGESGLDRADANEIVTNNLEAAQKAVEKASKLKPKKTTNPFTLQAERERIAGEQAAAQNALDYWKTVQSRQTALRNAELEQSRAEQAERDRIAHEQAIAAEEARQAEVLAQREEQAQRGAHAVHPAIREKWEAAPKIEGFENEITLPNGERVSGRYMLVESGAATPSHNPNGEFVRNEGFPVDENGNTVNDRDYERDKGAQDITREMGRTYDSRALQSTPVVSRDGVVLSGNGRTMAGELAAQAGTDGAYLDHLRKYGQQFGFTPEQVGSMQHPRVVFVPDADMPYTTETFAKFNAPDMKGQNRTESAVKMGKTVDDATFGLVISSINGFDTLSEFYNDPKAATEAINELRGAGVINAMQYGEMFDGDKVSGTGRQMLENMLIGKAFESNPDAIRQLSEFPALRQRVVAALAEVSNNLKLGEDYSLESELAEAINLAYQALKNGYKQGEPVSLFARQLNLFPFDMGRESVADYTNATILMLADVLNHSEVNKLKKVLAMYNHRAAESAAGQMDLFSGEVTTKEQIIKEVLAILNYGTKQEQQAAVAEAVERRKAEAQPTGSAGVQQDGANDASRGGEQPAGGNPDVGGRGTDDAASEELEKEVEPSVGPFGEIYTQFQGKPKEAITFLLAKRSGEAIGALHHKDIGSIDLVWGEEGTGHSDGYGLAKLAKYHPEVLFDLQEILDDMVVVKRSANRVQLESDKYKASVRLTWDEKKKTWLLTMFEKKNSALDNTTDTGKTLSSNGNDTATPESTVASDGKGSENSATVQEKTEKVAESKASTAIAEAEQEVNTEPTDAQKEAGNYKKGHIKLDGFDISIEQPKGSTRSGRDASGKEWSVTMQNTYGYIRGTEGVDGDHIDVFLSDNMDEWNGTVYVIDQVKADGSFDEHKVMYGFNSAEEAAAAYNSNYSEGWQGLGTITGVSKEEFKKWIGSSHRKTKPFADYKKVKTEEGQSKPFVSEDTEETPTNLDEMRAAHPYALFLVRGQKLYKAYGEDAKKLGEILGVEVKPDKKYGFVASFDHGDFDTNLPKIVRAGLRVAITESRSLKGDKPASGKKKTTKAADIAAEQTPASGEGKSGYIVEPAQYTTKRGKVLNMHLVKFGRELTKEEKQALTKFAKDKKGWWDKEKGGFMMRDEATAKQLGDMLGDEEAVKDNQPLSLPDVQSVNDDATVQAIDEAIKVEEKPQSTPQYDYDREDEVYDQVLAGLRETLNNANGNAIPNIKAIEKKIRELRKSITNVDNGLATAGEDTIGKAYETLATLTGRMKAYEKFLAELRKKMSETERDDALAARGVKLGDKVTYKGKKATIHDADARQVTLDVGLAPVLYEVTDWENVELPKQEHTAPQVQEVNVESLMGELGRKGEAKLSDHATPVEEQQPQAATSETSDEKSKWGSDNKLVSQSRYEELKKKMRKKIGGQANMGIDPELLAIGTEMAVYHIEAGARKFADYAKRMIADMGDAIRPYLKSFYNAVRDLPQASELVEDMDSYDTVSRFDVANFDQPTVDAMATAEQIANEQRMEQEAKEATEKIIKQRNDERKEKTSKGGKSKKKSVSLQQQTIPDLFSGLFGEEDSNLKPTSNEQEVHVQPRTGTSERERGHQREQNEPLGESKQNEDERPDTGRVARRSGNDTKSDTAGGSRVSEPSDGKRNVKPAKPEPAPLAESERKNTHNNHAERGTDYAPKGTSARIEANIKAIETMQRLIENGEPATPEDMSVLRKFSGWGGLGAAFKEKVSSGDSGYNPRLRDDYQPANPINARLRELLSPEAYEAANMSRNTAYYTPAPIIDAMWDVARAMGFRGGNVLEGSAGIGNIIGLMPTDMSERSNIHAVEIDETTGNILSLLYPDANVEVKGFEKTFVPNGSVDLAITNVPFVTGLRVMDETGDKDLSRKFHDIHDFCIAKNVRKLKEGGVGIFITSSGTLDSPNSAKLRTWLVNEGGADVVGAFRMHNQTFGGTGATSDIIVIRKRVNGRKSANAIDVSGTLPIRTVKYNTGETKRGSSEVIVKDLALDVNKHFVEHPEDMAGEMAFAFEKGDTYRATSKALYPSPSINQEQRLSEWAQQFKDMDWDKAEERESQQVVYEDLGEDVKEGSMLLDSDGNLCLAQRGKAVPINVNANKVKGHTKAECFNAYKAIKDALADVLEYQTTHSDDSGLQQRLAKLNKAYDSFVKTYGHLNKNTSISFLRSDMDYPSIAALESVSETGDKSGKRIVTYGKTDIFSRRVVETESEPKPTTIKDGIIASIYLNGRVDVPYIAEQLNMSDSDVRQQIIESGLGFENPTTTEMEVSYEYLSGNVREKLRQAQENNTDGRYDANIKALERVIPMNIPAHLIEFTLGSSWVEPKLYEDFVKERTGLDVKLTNAGGTWIMSEPYYTNTEQNKAMGVISEKCDKTILGHELIKAAITCKSISVTKTISTGYGSSKTTETIVDKEATMACANKIDEIRQDFKDWARGKMQGDPEMSERMERVYNELFNNSVPKEIPDDFVPEHFGGAATVVNGKPFKLRPHQAKAVIRATTQPLMLAHEVGTGKTYTLISTAMEMRRLGTARKPMIVVQNATVGQFVASAKALYPNAKILTLEDADRNAEGRRNFYAKIRYNDWDMIVVPQSVFERIPDSEERQIRFVEDKVEEKMMVLEKMREAANDDRDPVLRQAQRELDQLNDELNDLKLALQERKSGGNTEKDEKREAKTRQNAMVKAQEMLDRETDDVANFDDMGIDALLIDEAHEYKHLGFATAMQRGVKGVDPSYSKKSQGVYLKTQAVLESKNGKNVVFATGTPISNTAAEIWTFMRYLMPADTMREYGIYYFDDFVRNFGNIQQMLEFSTNGKYKENNRFAGYVNLPELVRIWAGVADTVLTREAGGVSDKIPKMEGEKAQDIYLPQTKALRGVMKFVKDQLDDYEKMSGKEKKENSHIPLVMYGIAKAAAVDARLVLEDAADEPNSKTNEAVRQTLRSLEDTKEYNGTVAIFADNYQNKATGFNLYEDIRKKLIDAGVPEAQVVVMKSGMSIKKKLEIFDKVNRGEVRVIMGSTFTLGTGVNIQERLHTLIHVDAPNRPMDYTQRNGRILRQGNLHNEWGIPVRVLRFGVEDSLDVTAYQRLKTKGAIADSIMEGKKMMSNSMENRVLEEEQDLFGDITAQLSGSQYALLKNQVEKEVKKLEARKKQWEADQTYVHNQKPRLKALIKDSEERAKRNKEALARVETAKNDGITIGKMKFPSLDAMTDYLKDYNSKQREQQEQVRTASGYKSEAKSDLTVSVGGFDFHIHRVITKEQKQEKGQLSLSFFSKTQMTYSCPELGLEDVPVDGQRLKSALEDILENVLSGDDFREKAEYADRAAERYKGELQQVEARDGKPFEYADELKQAKEKLAEYEELMKAEMAEKEAKYAEMDASVEAAKGVQLSDEDSDDVTEDTAKYRIREDEPPTKTGIGYKVFVLKDGKLYPPMVANPNGEATPVGVWLDADAAPVAGVTKTGRQQVKAGGKGTQGGSGKLAYRPGWHLGEIPYALQFNRMNPETGQRELFPANFVWAEVEYANDVDYQEEAMSYGMNASGKFQHSLAGLPRLPENGSYRYRTNPDPNTDPWIITGAMKVNRILKPSEVDAMVEAAGREPQQRQAGAITDEQVEALNAKVKRTMQEDRDMMRSAVQQMGEKLHTDINIIEDVNEITHPNAAVQERRRKSKGWYNKATGEVVIVVPNNNSIADVEATVLHEIVGHKGLRELFGKDFDAFLGNVFNNVDEETRRKIVDRAMRNGWDFKKATEEYLASLAESTDFENEVNRSAWQKIKDFFMELLRKAGIMLSRPLTDADLRYILWRSYQRRVEQGAMGVAADVVMRERLGVDGEGAAERDEMMFRDDDFSVRDRAVARDEYERMVSSGSYQFQEAVQDSMLGLKRLYQSILGKETRIEDIAGNENAYLAENRMSSVNAAEQHEYYIRYMKPLLEAISKIAGKNKTERERLSDYMMAKHGLERNLVLAERDAREAEAAGGDYNDAYASCRERDYAGLTALTGEADVAAAEAAAQQIVDDYERAHDTTDLWQRVNDATSATLEKIYRSGLLSVERYQQIQQMFENYIPLQGWDETTSDEVYGYLTSKYGPLTGSPIKRAQGRSSKADDPIATIALMADTAIRQGNRNKMKQTFLNFVLNHPSDLVSVNSLWLQYNAAMDEWEPVFADIEPTDTAADVERKVEAFEARMEQLAEDEPDKYKRGRDAQSIPYKVVRDNMREHQVLVKRGGETYVLTINGNPRAAQALNGLTNPDVETGSVIGNLMQVAQWINRNLSAFYTTRNPDFIVSNFFRDMLYSNCMTWVKESPRYALRFHWNFGRVNPIRLRGLLAKWEKGTLDDSNYIERNFKLFMQNGGETGYTNVRDIEGHKRTIIRELKRMKGNIVKAAWRLLGVQFDLLNRSAENCARFAAFLTSRELGRSIERSVYDAKEVSVNFNKKGAGDKMLGSKGQERPYFTLLLNPKTYFNKTDRTELIAQTGSYVSGGGRLLYVFWNAGVQGSTNFMRQAKRHPFKFTAGAASMFVLGAVIPILAKAMGGDDDDDENAYYNLPEYVRRSNIIINAGDQWIAIPLPIEFRALYGLGELSTGVVSGNERYSGSELAYNIGSQVSQIMPLDMLEGGGGLNPFIPSAAKPFVEAYWLNKNWTGLPIYKDTPWNKDDPEWTKAYKSANTYLVSGAQWLNELSGGDEYRKGWIDINPSKVEYLLSGMFGGLFTTTDKLVKMGETAIGSRDFDWRNMLIANRVVKTGDERTANRKLTNEYYKYKDSYEDTKRLLKKYGEKAESDEAYRSRLESLMQSDDYLIYEVFDNYQPLFDVLYDAKKGADENTVKTIENEERVLRREMIDLLHEIEDDKHPDYNQRVDAMLKREFSGGGLTQQKAGSVIAKRMGGKDTYGSPDTEYGEIYLQKRDYFDLAEDVLLQSEWKKAKDSGDTERASAIDKARKELTTIKKGKHTKSANIPGLGEGDDDKVMEQLRTRRREILKEFGITPQQTNR